MTQNRFANRREAFWHGIRDAMGAPVLVLFAGMVGFGAMGRTHGFDAWMTGLTSLLMFALPGQVVMLEMFISGSSLLAIGFAVTLTSTRFVTMVVTLFPQLHRRDRNPLLYLWVHMLAMTAWAVSMREFPRMRPQHRLNYFIGLALPCWLISPLGTVLGYYVAGWVPTPVTLALVFINPLFFLLTFTDVKPWGNRLAIGLGCLLGPLFFMMDADSSLLLTGLVGGTAAYLIDRRWLRPRPVEVQA
ncbi:MAG TPA: AzlC family ABC transporter permease [Limnohabitans sp.]|uniref:AzlC family ABC transporter permease n=1 Tax=Limnohabitans sp. TaxID=1907725 RepID=UPI002B63744E|nr:AzlC family ABC transporter permease [Limnohabitans sp.]HQR86053.1 AzlC family ABC transporter permease [Limnohabitans sp.]HQS26031.1 AzlC family ABC transporter permease [Limnohabitans sp.]